MGVLKLKSAIVCSKIKFFCLFIAGPEKSGNSSFKGTCHGVDRNCHGVDRRSSLQVVLEVVVEFLTLFLAST